MERGRSGSVASGLIRPEFDALWDYAESLGAGPTRGDQYLVGVVRTCRWLAARPVRDQIIRRSRILLSPITRRALAVMPETVEAEYVAALSAPSRDRELARGVAATLAWACRGSARAPYNLPPSEFAAAN